MRMYPMLTKEEQEIRLSSVNNENKIIARDVSWFCDLFYKIPIDVKVSIIKQCFIYKK